MHLNICPVLQYVPVDTIICFRASCPIVIAIIEFFYLGRELPSLRSWASLIGENSAPPQGNVGLHYTQLGSLCNVLRLGGRMIPGISVWLQGHLEVSV